MEDLVEANKLVSVMNFNFIQPIISVRCITWLKTALNFTLYLIKTVPITDRANPNLKHL